jgi:hypothetical protein
VRVTVSPGATPTGSAHTVRPRVGADAVGAGSGLVNTEGEGSGIGVGSGEVKAAEPIAAVEGIPGGLKGRGHAVESRDKTSHTETLG